MESPQLHQEVELTIHDLGISGEGVGKWNGYTLFVDGALPGEKVKVKTIECRKTYGRAELISIINPSPNRVKPICPIFDKCGGCQIMHLDYTAQLNFKRERVLKALKHIGKIDNPPVEPCIPSPSSLYYRNKIQLITAPFYDKMVIGLYAKHSHDAVPVEKCYIHCEQGEKLFHTIRTILMRSSIEAYDPKNEIGVLRHILIRTATNSKESLVIFVTGKDSKTTLEPIAKEIIRLHPNVKGVIQNVNSRNDNVILGKDYEVIVGENHMMEKLGGLYFKISPASFFQVNTLQAEAMYAKAIEYADLKKDDLVLDAYCGVGTLTLMISQNVDRVIGIESVPQAINDAKENAERNKIKNSEFYCLRAEEFVPKISYKVDVVFLNPPRKGCEPIVIESIGLMKPRKVIYVSCDPATLARDSALLMKHGYLVEKVQPFDMFPQTAHVETIIKFSLNKS